MHNEKTGARVVPSLRAGAAPAAGRASATDAEASAGARHRENVLVVDLDGTLIKADLLHETASRFILRHPLRSPLLVGWLAAGRSVLKARLAEACEVDPAVLPYHAPLVDWLREERRQGRILVLATASHRRLAEQVARHLGIFDAVLATEGETNLAARHKRDLLLTRYGERGFDYVGNDAADLAVLQVADRGYLAGASPRLIARARALGNLARVFDDGRPGAPASLVRALRPHQWLKNLLVFVPLLAAHRYGDGASLAHGLLAFVAFSLAASSAYLFNDLVDIADDRHHPRKQRRPFAAGDASLLHGWLAWPALLLAAFAVAGALLPPAFLAPLAAYLALTLAYSLRLKRDAIVDVLTLAGLYTLRIVAGAAAIGVPLSFWLLAFSMFIFLSLAFMKRFSELEGACGPDRQAPIRGRGYTRGDLRLVFGLGTGAGYIAVLVLALYIQDARTAGIYPSPTFIWLACPLLLFWISRAWLIAHRGRMHEDPVVFTLKDRVSWAVGVCLVAAFGLARTVT